MYGNRDFCKTVLGLLMVLGLTVGNSIGQKAGAEGGNPIAGTWHQQLPAQAGGTIHNFMNFGENGSFFSSSVNVGGQANGVRTEMWGTYTIKGAGNGGYLVTMYYTGKAPLQLCMQGMGCRSNGGVPSRPDQGIFQFQGNMFQSTNGFTAERSAMPAALAQRLPATWMLQPPPPLNVPSGDGHGGRYVSPKNKIPGLGGNCDDLQQSRVCTDGGGWYHKDQSTGCMVCSK